MRGRLRVWTPRAIPDGTPSSEGSGGTGAHVTGVTPGTYEPTVSPHGCTTMDPFPFDHGGGVIVLGDIVVTSGAALYDTSLFVH